MRPKIQENDTVREMTDAEFQDLLDMGWTPGEQNASLVVEEEVTDAPLEDLGGGPSAG